MTEFASAVIFGVVTGSLYGLAALGLVVVYRTSRVLNFALAGTATVTSYIAYSMLKHGANYALVIVVTLLCGCALGAGCQLLIRLVRSSSTLTLAVTTFGIMLLLQGMSIAIWGTREFELRGIMGGSITLGSIHVGYIEVISVVVAGLAFVACWLIIYRTRMGLELRAISSGRYTSELLGVKVRRIELASWALAGGLGSLGALLFVPLLQLDQNVVVEFVLVAFTAVVLGGFVSLGGVMAAGVAVSIGVNLLSTYVSSTLPSSFTFLIIAAVLLFRPYGLFGRRERLVAEPQIPSNQGRLSLLRGLARGGASIKGAVAIRTSHLARSAKLPGSFREAALGTALGLAVLIGALKGGAGLEYTLAGALVLLPAVAGAGIIIGLSDQPTLAQAAFVGVGAYAAGIGSSHLHLSVWVCAVLAIAVGGALGAAVGGLVARLSGVYTVVFTLALMSAFPEALLSFSGVTGGVSGLTVAVPAELTSGGDEFIFGAVIAVVALGAYLVLTRSQLGRRWRSVRDSPQAVASMGWSPGICRTTAFAAGAALASLAGWAGAVLVGFVSPDQYNVFYSLNIVVAVIVGGANVWLGAVAGVLLITLVPYFAAGSAAPEIVLGLALIGALILAPDGIAGLIIGGSRAVNATGPVRLGLTKTGTKHSLGLEPELSQSGDARE